MSYLSIKMAAMFVVAQIFFCATLILAELPPCTVTHNWFYQSSLVYTGNASPAVVRLAWGVPVPQRDDYTYPKDAASGYKVHVQAVPWMQARRTCAEEGGHLAILNSVTEANMVVEIFRKSEPVTGSRYPHFASVGFHSLFESDQFATVLDQNLTTAGFDQWFGNGPYIGHRRYCGSFHLSGRLNNHGCPTPLAFICEIPNLY